jgi:thiol-disulfide isomerase/thioredoxin
MKIYSRVFIIKIIFTFLIKIGHGQDFKAFRVGDTIPESLYREVSKLGTAGEKFSKSEGKLIVLDFWHSSCFTCLMSFPKMEKIQKEFGDRVQVFLVNAFEDSVQIAKRMEIGSLKKYAVNSLPIIANAKVFQNLFPHKAVPHHVWIDGSGVVKVVGSPLNTNSEKITALLKGDHVFSLNGTNNSKSVDKQTSLFDIENRLVNKDNELEYLFTGHNNEYSSTSPQIFENVIDSVHQKKKDTYINNDLLELYNHAYFKDIAYNHNKMVYSGPFSINSGYWKDYFLIEVKDTLKVSSSYIPFLELTDKQYIKSRFCYEQFTPLNYSFSQRRNYMLSNLNKHFLSLYGIEGKLIEKEVTFFVLKSREKDNIQNSINGKTPLNSALQYLIFRLFSKQPNAIMPFVIDETGLKDIEGLILPDYETGYTFEDIVLALNNFGITVQEEIRLMKFVLIHEPQN